jgi:hypothetical protein
MSTQDFDKIEPTLVEDSKKIVELLNSPAPKTKYKSFIYRPNHDGAKLSMGVHSAPATVPFPKSTFEGVDFYRVEGKLWQLSNVGSDDLGIFVEFYRVEGEFKGYTYG